MCNVQLCNFRWRFFQYNDEHNLERSLSNFQWEVQPFNNGIDLNYIHIEKNCDSDDQTEWYLGPKFTILEIDDRIKNLELQQNDTFVLFY